MKLGIQHFRVVLLILGVQIGRATPVETGLDRVSEYQSLWQGQRIGIMANQTAQDRQGRFIVDVFLSLAGIEVTALYAPEHGLWGTAPAGAEVSTVIHPKYKIPVYSLYGPDEQAQPPILDHVDIVVFDMQDIGARFYTYVSSMALAMEAVAKANKRFVVLDRPNPLGGLRREGPLLESAFQSFKGYFPIPVIHGMTVGELARLIVGENWHPGSGVDLTVIPVKGWTREMTFPETGLRFIRPSPNIPDVETALVYPGMALIEGTNVSEGRGTPHPFKQLGAPWICGQTLAKELNALNVPGVQFVATTFTPQSSKYAGQECHGVRINIVEEESFRPFLCGNLVLKTLHTLYAEHLKWHLPHLDELVGSDGLRRAIEEKGDLAKLNATWQMDIQNFNQTIKPYLLYP